MKVWINGVPFREFLAVAWASLWTCPRHGHDWHRMGGTDAAWVGPEISTYTCKRCGLTENREAPMPSHPMCRCVLTIADPRPWMDDANLPRGVQKMNPKE